MKDKNYKVVILDGFTNEEISQIVKAIKPMFQGRDIIFARPTFHTKKWTVEKLIEVLHEEIEEHKGKAY
jgi:hypothetical protein